MMEVKMKKGREEEVTSLRTYVPTY